MQWLVLTEGLPIGAWREKIGLSNECQLCEARSRETLQHSFFECPEVSRTWELFRSTRQGAGLVSAYHTWKEVSRGLMKEPEGPRLEEDLRWDTTAAFTLTLETPWDILRANTLWAIWCQRVELAFRNEPFHLGLVLWSAWRNTVYCGMEAFKELFHHKRNEEKRQEAIECFQTVWTNANIFGRRHEDSIRWNLTPHQKFLPKELGTWLTPPIRIIRQSPSPEPEAEFVAQPNLEEHIDDFLQGIAANWRPRPPEESSEAARASSQAYQQEPDLEGGSPSIPDEEATRAAEAGCSYQASETLHCLALHIYGNEVKESVDQQHLPSVCLSKVTSRNKRKCERIKAKPVLSSPPKQRDVNATNTQRLPPKSRSKRRCKFGPRACRGHARVCSEPQPSKVGTPPSKHRGWDASAYWLPKDLDADPSQVPDDSPRLASCNILTPPASSTRTPFGHYKVGHALGKVAQDVDELLEEIGKEKLTSSAQRRKHVSLEM